METGKVVAKPIHKIINKEITSANAPEYRMSINIKVNGLSLLIMHDQKIIQALNYNWQTPNWSSCVNNLNSIFNSINFIKFRFKTKFIFIDSKQSMLIPDEFYSLSRQQQLLNKYLGNDNFIAHTQKLKNENASLVFGVEKSVDSFIRKNFIGFKIFHNSAMLIDNVLSGSRNATVVSLRVDSSFFEIMISNNSKLIAHNNFEYKTIDEFMFLLLSFVKQNGFDTNKVELILCDKLLMSSPIAMQLQQYFVNIVEYKSDFSEEEAVFASLIKNYTSANN